MRTSPRWTPSRRRRSILLGVTLALGLVTSACTPAGDPAGDDSASSTSPSSPPSTTSTSPQEQEPATVDLPVPPAPGDDEVARTIRNAVGRDDVPETGDTAARELVADIPVTVEGACEGESATMPFTLWSADPEQERQTLIEGTITCGTGLEKDDFTYQFPYAGPAQVTVDDTAGLAVGWVRVLQPAE